MSLDRDQGLMICGHCGSQMAPPLDEEGVLVIQPNAHACPACRTTLADASIDGCPIIYCAGCHGVLIEMDRFVALLELLREQRYWSRSSQGPRARDAGRVLQCPLCGLEMDLHPYGGGGNVDVDSCEKCGVLWLDRGELSRIVAAPDRDPIPDAPLPAKPLGFI